MYPSSKYIIDENTAKNGLYQSGENQKQKKGPGNYQGWNGCPSVSRREVYFRKREIGQHPRVAGNA